MASTTGDLDRLSGVVLPLILQRKLQSQQEAEGKADSNNKKSKSGNDTSAVLPQDDDSRVNSIFTAQELGELTWKTRSAMADIQRQLLRGEESYHEETNAHGSLFRGWDLFIDAKDPGAPAVSTASNRRMPADNRWFSSSCTSAGRTPRPMPALNKNLLLKKAPVAARSASNTLPKAAVANVASGRGTAKPVGDVKAVVLPQGGGVATRVAGVPAGGALTRPTLPVGGAQAAAKGQTAGSNLQGQVNASASDVAAGSIQGETGSGRRTRKRKASDA
jgi:hypothetical protein